MIVSSTPVSSALARPASNISRSSAFWPLRTAKPYSPPAMGSVTVMRPLPCWMPYCSTGKSSNSATELPVCTSAIMSAVSENVRIVKPYSVESSSAVDAPTVPVLTATFLPARSS